MPLSTIPSCSCSWLWSGTVAPGSKSIRLSIAPSPKSGLPLTPAASSKGRTWSKRTNCGSMRAAIIVQPRDRRRAARLSRLHRQAARARPPLRDRGHRDPAADPHAAEADPDSDLVLADQVTLEGRVAVVTG